MTLIVVKYRFDCDKDRRDWSIRTTRPITNILVKSKSFYGNNLYRYTDGKHITGGGVGYLIDRQHLNFFYNRIMQK